MLNINNSKFFFVNEHFFFIIIIIMLSPCKGTVTIETTMYKPVIRISSRTELLSQFPTKLSIFLYFVDFSAHTDPCSLILAGRKDPSSVR